jgi:murein L,D-transpeptidase YcbB/YkuD
MNATWGVVTALLVLGSGVARAAGPDPLETSLRQVVDQSAAAYQKEDVAGFMQHVHTKSPEYQTTRERLSKQFAEMDVTATVTDFRLMGHDDEFAVARMKLRTTSNAPGFVDNVVDQLVLFHQEGGVWKYWGDYEIGVELIGKK